MKNFVQPGNTLPLTAPYDVSSGAGFQVGALFAVALCAAVAGAQVEGVIRGVYTLPKPDAQAWAVGARIYWDDVNKRCDSDAAKGSLIGVAVTAAANASTVGHVRLNGCVTGGGGAAATVPGQPAKPVLTAMAGAVSVAWTPGASGSTATTGNAWTDTSGNVTQLTTNPQVIGGLVVGVPYSGTVTTRNAQGAGPVSTQAEAVTPTAQPALTTMSSLLKDVIFGSSTFAAQVGMHDASRQSILFRNETPYWGQYVLTTRTNNDSNQPTGTWVDIPPNVQVLVTDPGKPYVRGKAFAIVSITSDGTTATVTTAAPHGLTTGASVRIQDVTPAGYAGAFPNVTVTGESTFTYPLASSLGATTVPGTWAGRPLTGFTVQTKAIK